MIWGEAGVTLHLTTWLLCLQGLWALPYLASQGLMVAKGGMSCGSNLILFKSLFFILPSALHCPCVCFYAKFRESSESICSWLEAHTWSPAFIDCLLRVPTRHKVPGPVSRQDHRRGVLGPSVSWAGAT